MIIANTTELYDEPITKQKGKNKSGKEHYTELMQKNRDSFAPHDRFDFPKQNFKFLQRA